jgi:Lrp/AsnC family transcriptional regulator for asnA, asnC and gidA
MKIDRTSIEIIKHLRDGRKSFGQIAKDLDVAENTVRSRVNRLMEQGVLDISGLIDPEALPRHQSVIIGVKLTNVDLIKKGEAFSTLRGVVSVSVVTGRFDLIVTVLLKEGFGLLEFYTEEVARVEGVQSVEAFVVYKGFNVKMPYIL